MYHFSAILSYIIRGIIVLIVTRIRQCVCVSQTNVEFITAALHNVL